MLHVTPWLFWPVQLEWCIFSILRWETFLERYDGVGKPWEEMINLVIILSITC